MLVRASRRHTPPWRAREEATLEQEGLEDVLDRVARLGQRRRERLDAHGAPFVDLDDRAQEPPIHRVETERIDPEPLARRLGDRLVDDGGRTVGYACFGPIPCSLTSWDLYWIAVEDMARGRGLGRALLRRAEDAVRARGGRAIYIETSSKPQYDATRAFYRACGYDLEHVFADFYAPGDGKAVYSKRF